MYPKYIKKLIQVEDVIIKKVSHGLSNTVFVMLETKPKVYICPKCSSPTSRVHDYRLQRIKHIPFGINSSILILRKRPYVCSCGKRFYENYSWLPKYQRMTKNLIMYICHQLWETVSYTHVAKQANVSIPTVIRTFNRISYPKLKKTPKVLCIDEFRGNAETGKFQCILVNRAKNMSI